MANFLNQHKRLVCIGITVIGLLGYNFINAQWQAPTALAPNDNTEAPINISANYQAKLGDLGAVRMRAGEYCDAAGLNCVTSSGVGGGTWGTWTDVTASRAGRVWYHNNASTGRVVHYNTNYGAPQVYVSPTGTGADDVIVSSQDGDSGEFGPGSFIVPPGHYYFFGNTTAFRFVSELQLPF